MELSADELRLRAIFFPRNTAKVAEILSANSRFVHYTSAEVAMSILQNRSVWMRNSSVMNDFSEIEYGIKCLVAAYRSRAGTELKAFVEKLFPGSQQELETLFDGWQSHFRSETYIACLSEHLPYEDNTGRLSMWRAYGGSTGVALVVRSTPFIQSTDALKAYSSPVAYLTEAQFAEEFAAIVASMTENADFLLAGGRQRLIGYLFTMFRFAIICTKHPGFHEEREWRIVYAPTIEKSDIIAADLQLINGVPQIIHKLPLKHAPEHGLIGADIPSLLDRVIIGPSQYPLAAYHAFVRLLEAAGVEEAASKVWASDIPLRR
jgi:hypothetical protein